MAPSGRDRGESEFDATIDTPYALATPGSGDSLVMPAVTEVDEATEKLPTSLVRARVTLVALSAAAFLVVTNEAAPLGLITPMATALGRAESDIGLVTTVFALTVMLGTVPLALLTTKMIRRWVLVFTMVIWTGGVLLAATADTFNELLAHRVVTGFAHALFWAVVTPAAAGMFPMKQRGKSVTRLLIGTSLVGVIGVPGSTLLAQRVDWHAPYWVLAVAGAVLALAIGVLMPSFKTEQSTVVRGEIPSLSRYARVLGVAILSTGGMAITWTYISPFITEVTGFSDGAIPKVFLVSGCVGVASMFLAGRYLDRFPVKAVVFGQALLVVLWVGLMAGGASKVIVLIMMGIQSLGWSVLVASMVNWALRHSPWSSDIGNAAYAAVFNMGTAAGSVIGARMLDGWGPRWLPIASLVCTLVALGITVGVGTMPALKRTKTSASRA